MKNIMFEEMKTAAQSKRVSNWVESGSEENDES